VYCEGTSSQKEHRGMKLVHVQSAEIGPLTTILFDLLCLWRARKEFDIVYMLGAGASFFCFLPRLYGADVWINIDGLEWKRPKWSRVGRAYLKLAARFAMLTASQIIADAEAIATVLQEQFGQSSRCTTIAYGADLVATAPPPSVLKRWEIDSGEYYLIVCRLEPENHIREIVAGFLASGSRRILLVIGDHLAKTKYIRDLVQLGNNDRVKFAGPVYDRLQLNALRCHCFAYFHGHSVGGTNPSLLEAMACGSPVIAHDNRFNREVASGAALYFGRAHDIPSLCSRIESDELLRSSLASTGKERVLKYYSWDLIATKYVALINKFGSGHDTNVSLS